MLDYQQDFISLSIKNKILNFGSFTLKSGRQSPYFYNSGLFNTGAVLSAVSKCYAKAAKANFDEKDYDVLFGPAYKGIALATSMALSLAEHEGIDKPFAFNRKEAKAHGEGGSIVGASIANKRVLLVDDVITSGKAIREAMEILKAENATLVGILISLDRQERGRDGPTSAIDDVSKEFNVPVKHIVGLEDVIEYLTKEGGCSPEQLDSILAYRKEYGV